MRRPKTWPPAGNHRDDRLVFFAAEPELVRRATPLWMQVTGLQMRPGATMAASDQRRDMGKGRMMAYVMATQRAAERLDPIELDEVRRTGVLPDWFFDEVEEQRRNARRR